MKPGRDVWWHEAVESRPGALEPVEVESETPYLLAYTSGTTGRPKGALHVQGGFLALDRTRGRVPGRRPRGRPCPLLDGHGLDHGAMDGGRREACGATVVFLEGAPDRPHDRLWRTVEEERVTMLGVSPTLVRALHPPR